MYSHRYIFKKFDPNLGSTITTQIAITISAKFMCNREKSGICEWGMPKFGQFYIMSSIK